jgi:hypothetical protein
MSEGTSGDPHLIFFFPMLLRLFAPLLAPHRNQEKWRAFNGTLTVPRGCLCSIFPPSQEVLDGSRRVIPTAGYL